MIYGSVCSGIEAATVAWHGLGWRPAFFSEIEPFPSRVLAHHYPDVPNRGDMTKFAEWPDAAIDVLVGGTPCQSFSVAGLRKGMADPRGNLALVYLAMADRYRPRWLVWENVPGVLSSNGGRDFGAFLGGLVELGYGFAYRVLDAQYFGLAQRRKRVFVVGHLGDWRRAAAVLLERESLRGDPAPRREAREGTAGRAVASVALRGRDGGAAAEVGDDCGFTLRASQGGGDKPHVLTWPAEVASTLNAAFGDKQGLEDQHALGGGQLFVPAACRAVPERGGHGPAGCGERNADPDRGLLRCRSLPAGRGLRRERGRHGTGDAAHPRRAVRPAQRHQPDEPLRVWDRRGADDALRAVHARLLVQRPPRRCGRCRPDAAQHEPRRLPSEWGGGKWRWRSVGRTRAAKGTAPASR